MWCLFVCACGLTGSISLNQHKSSRVILVLDNVETGDARLFYTLTRIRKGRFDELLYALRLHPNMNMDDQHGRWKRCVRSVLRGFGAFYFWFVNSRFNERLQISAIPGLLHVFKRNKAQRG